MTLAGEEVELLIPSEIGVEEEGAQLPDITPRPPLAAEARAESEERQVSMPVHHDAEPDRGPAPGVAASTDPVAPCAPQSAVAEQSTPQLLRSAPEWHSVDMSQIGRGTPGNGNVVVRLVSGISVVLPSAQAIEPPSAGARAVAATAHLLQLLDLATRRAVLALDGIDGVGATPEPPSPLALEPVNWLRGRAARLLTSWRSWQAAQR